MRRALVALSAVAVACAAAAVACSAAGIRLLAASGFFGAASAILTRADVERGQPLVRAGTALASIVLPLGCGALLAVIAILGLLAVRWESRRPGAAEERA